MSPIDPYLGAQAPAQDFIRTFLDREIPAGLLFYAPFLPQTGNQAWAADKRIVVPTVETVDADGSYFASDGLIRRARANALRMEGLGGLIEGARTNLCIHSNDFSNAAWVKTNMNIGVDVVPLPDGTTGTVNTLVATAANATIIQDLGVLPNVAYAFSVYLQRKTGAGIVDITLDNGATWTAVTIYAGRWVRVDIIQALASPDVGIRLQTNTDEVYVAFAQPETGPSPTSYIPTVATTVARAQENIQYSNAGQIHCQAATGTLIVAATPNGPTANGIITDTYDNGTASGLIIRIVIGLWRATHYSGGAVATLNSITAPAIGVTHILATSWQVNNFKLYVNGVLEASDAAGAAPAAVNNILYVGQGRGLTSQFEGNLSHWCYYNRVLSGPEIEQRSHFLHNQMARAS